MSGLDLNMGKYALYVWPAFGVSAVVLAALVVEALARSAGWRRQVRRLERDSHRKDPA